jgi:hypothetical protein
MAEFEDANLAVLATLHAHQVQRTQQALDALMRAQTRRSRAIAEMQQFLDTLDSRGQTPAG